MMVLEFKQFTIFAVPSLTKILHVLDHRLPHLHRLYHNKTSRCFFLRPYCYNFHVPFLRACSYRCICESCSLCQVLLVNMTHTWFFKLTLSKFCIPARSFPSLFSKNDASLLNNPLMAQKYGKYNAPCHLAVQIVLNTAHQY